jgi:cation diffusion facilitator CzcD-associated flavoprotein CzcO
MCSPRFHAIPAAPGCKRIIVDPDYLDSLHRPNVTLTFDEIERIVPEGVQLKNGDIVLLDVLIFGTGFSLVRLCLTLIERESRH